MSFPTLPGGANSRPVRIGNGAWNQRQLDVYGELLDAVARLAEHLGRVDDATRTVLRRPRRRRRRAWREPDQGIWEVRGEPRHFLYSKLMCWVALDRAIKLAERLPRT